MSNKLKKFTTREKQISEKKIVDKVIVDNFVSKSNRILYKISSHAFPFDFFPNSLVIEESRVNIITRELFSSQVYSVDIRNIANVLINSTFFFSQLVIISKTFEKNEVKIRNLRKNEALFARRIIEGLRTFKNKKIATSSFTKEELLFKLQQLSTTKIEL